MKKFRAFKSLKIGQTVTLAEERPAYGCGYPTADGRAYVPAGTAGTVAVVNVPSVTGRNGVARLFSCVDFPPDTPLVDFRGRPVIYENPHRNKFRVAAYPEELKA